MKVIYSTVTSLALILWLELGRSGMTMKEINQHLDTEQLKFGMEEQAVIKNWGEGKFLDGFGGHRREYVNKNIRVSFSNDRENDLYRKVSGLTFSNPAYSIFGIKIGLKREEAIKILSNHGFDNVDYSQDIFVNGEYSIALSGQHIDLIEIWFNDKDLKHRLY